MEVDNKTLGTNIKTLRMERRLSIEEFSEQTNISTDRIKAFEDGSERPLFKELLVMCPILRISDQDILERDILAERKDAEKRMKGKESRTNFNWYYGDKKHKIFLICWIVSVIIFYTINFLIIKQVIANSLTEENNITQEEYDALVAGFKALQIFGPLVVAGIINTIFMVIEIFKFRAFRFSFWFIYILFLIGLPIVIGIASILTLPSIIYAFYQLIAKKGK